MKRCREVWLAGLTARRNGLALKEAPEEMKGDRELCMAAVTQNWQALQWASEEMKGDRELCTAAVAQNGEALQYCSAGAAKGPQDQHDCSRATKWTGTQG